MSNEIWAMSFDDLKMKFPRQVVTLYRYKVKNFNTTLRNIVIHPRRNILLQLENETKIEAINDTYRNEKTPISISSGQATGASKLVNNSAPSLLVQKLIPADYETELYVYTRKPIPPKQVSLEDIYIDNLTSAQWPELQELQFKGTQKGDLNVVNVLQLQKLQLTSNTSLFNITSIYWEDLSYFDGNSDIILRTQGPLGQFVSAYLDQQDSSKQMNYKLKEDDTHKHFVLDMQPSEIRPFLNMSVSTFDFNKNMTFDLARLFITPDNTFLGINKLWRAVGLETNIATKGTPEGDLNHAFLTAVWCANQKLKDYKEYRVTDTNSQNYNKIQTGNFISKLFAFPDFEVTKAPKEVTAFILKTWEEKHRGALETSAPLKKLYDSVKGLLAGLGANIPGPQAYGNYEQKGKLAMNWFFIPQTMEISIDQVNSLSNFQIKLDSLRYKFDSTTKQISGLKDEYLEISKIRTFDLDGKISLPQVPQQFTEENIVSTPGSANTDSNSYLGYQLILQLKGSDKYQNLFGTNNPFEITGETPNSHIYNYNSGNIPFTPNPSAPPYFNWKYPSLDDVPFIPPIPNRDGDTTTTQTTYTVNEIRELEIFITNNYILNTREIVDGSAQLIITQTQTYRTFGYGDKWIRNEYTYSYSWTERPKQSSSSNVVALTPPSTIDQTEFEKLTTSLDNDINEYLLAPKIELGPNAIRKLSDIAWKDTFSNWQEIVLKAVKKDGTKEDVTLRFTSAFRTDQSQVQEGIYT